MKLSNIFYLLFISFFLSSCASKQNTVEEQQEFSNGAVVTAHPIASEVGVAILKKGGNAVDAAIAVKFALAVVYPNAGNLGGGGFMVYRDKSGFVNSLDFREKAPQKAHRDMYLDQAGNPITDLSLYGQLASGVPGSVAGMDEAYKKYGKLPWKELLQPAIELASKGFPITEQQAGEFNRYQERFKKHNPNGAAIIREASWKPGDLFIQSALAETLKRIAEQGRDGFYKGKTADYIVAEMKRGNGIISLEDLANYQAVWRIPIVGTYKGYKVTSMPPPSSGGVALMALLQSVEKYPLAKWGFQHDSTVRAMVEAERRVYADRATHLGDPDFYRVPVNELTNAKFNQERMAKVSLKKATPSDQVKASKFPGYESEETTHYSIVDKEGNAVSLTTTINGSYGSLVWVEGAGFLLNNEMDDFSVKPGTPNMYGLLGGKANAVEPGKRMLSAMTPTIIEKDGKLKMVVGTPGGSTIITSVFQTILNVLEFDMTAQESVSAARFHHQWKPEYIDVEEQAIDSKTRASLEKDGYSLNKRGPIGRVENIVVLPNGKLQAGADPRGDDKAAGY
ncbi:gamma-glutamyltransferase [Sphingobacterium sp. DK4209]|uniref:Glutathione hydrolase proenzyme n=1 Tax=Sphingobacterium zhuxiongii TaxID=2662364 RepID=A0A5Q0QEM8_9SPHI|nr:MULTISPECIES: gamma-glutamyltransferase [unclassified Sphingobacterium]MVZ65620.1 gamma-glutamyltransferase [Sphingobacterium sp. DK4209]QGA27744.1 gamma-glutamyltransferase [Sphingobacterium sp. dk4302]